MQKQNVYCRKLRETDLERVMNWRMQPDITRYMNTDPKLTLAGQKVWFESIKNKKPFFYWVISSADQDVGLIYMVDYSEKACEWGYYVAQKSARSVALAVSLELSLYDFIFKATQVERIYAQTFRVNASVVRLHELCGCETEKILPGHVRKNGESFDVVVQYMPRTKWESIKEKMDYQPISFEY
jgi:UDP-4-amino-4,6-dideoxy-N-acetyl-beta-L-altrosamine N-acetyltransferase